MFKCWDDDTERVSRWTLTDGLLNGRNDERDRSTMWNTLRYAVHGVWPDLCDWIMCNPPSDDDITWFRSAGSFGVGEAYIRDLALADKYSSSVSVGFHSS